MALQKLCVKRIAESIDLYSSAYSSVESENLKRGFYLLQKIFSDELISYLISKRLLREQHANLVFNEYLKSIDTEWFATYSWSKIVEIFQRIGPNLEKVTFDIPHDGEKSNPALWNRLIQHLPNVKAILYKNLCDDDALRYMTRNCMKLKILNVAKSCVTDHGIKYFCQMRKGGKRDSEGVCLIQEESVPCPELKEIDLDSTLVTDEGVKQLLQNVPSLKVIGHPRLPAVLKNIYLNDTGCFYKTERITYLDLTLPSYRLRFGDLLIACAILCPNLRSVISPIYRVENLNFFSQFSGIVDLALCFRCNEGTSAAEVKDFLQEHGGKVTSMTFHKGSVSPSVLARHCPRLKGLYLDCVTIEYDENESVPVLNNLTRLTVSGVDLSDSENCKGICQILQSPVLEQLTFHSYTFLRPELKMQILTCCLKCPLKLVGFHLSSITKTFIKNILLTCSTLKMLELIGVGLFNMPKRDLYEVAESLPNKPLLKIG